MHECSLGATRAHILRDEILVHPQQAPTDALVEEYATIYDKKAPPEPGAPAQQGKSTFQQGKSTVDESSIARFPLLKPVSRRARPPSTATISPSIVDEASTTAFSTTDTRPAPAQPSPPLSADSFARKEDVAPNSRLQASKVHLNAAAVRSTERRSVFVCGKSGRLLWIGTQARHLASSRLS